MSNDSNNAASNNAASVELTDSHNRVGQYVVASYLGGLTAKQNGEKYNYDHLKKWMIVLGFSKPKPTQEIAAKMEAAKIAGDAVKAKEAFNELCDTLKTKSFGSEASTLRSHEFKDCFAIVGGVKVLSPIGKEVLARANKFLTENEAAIGKGKIELATLSIPEAVADRTHTGNNSFRSGKGKVLAMGSIGFDKFGL